MSLIHNESVRRTEDKRVQYPGVEDARLVLPQQPVRRMEDTGQESGMLVWVSRSSL